MEITTLQISEVISHYVWPVARVTGFVLAMPLIGTKLVPSKVKIIFVICLTYISSFLLKNPPIVELISVQAVIILGQEFIIGLLMGFMIKLVFNAFIFGGQIMAMQSGLGFASLVDPQNGSQVPVLGQLFLMIVSLLFLASNGHLMLIDLFINSFILLPINSDILVSARSGFVVNYATILFAGGVALALPAVVALLIVNFTFGTMTRSAPQLNIFSIGFPLTMVLGLFIISICMTFVLHHFNQLMGHALTALTVFVNGG